MEHRRAGRTRGFCEIALSTFAGAPILRASIEDMSEAGLLVGFVPPEAQATITVGQRVHFRFVLSTGEVSGAAEVVRVQAPANEIALRLVTIDNDGGLGNLLSYLHSWLAGVG